MFSSGVKYCQYWEPQGASDTLVNSDRAPVIVWGDFTESLGTNMLRRPAQLLSGAKCGWVGLLHLLLRASAV